VETKLRFPLDGATSRGTQDHSRDAQRGWPNEIALLFEADDLQKARQFVYSPEVPQVKEGSGVNDKPDVYFLT